MNRASRIRAAALGLVLASALASHIALAQTASPDPSTDETKYGVVMAFLCGTSTRVGLQTGQVALISVGVASCLAMVLDALATPDSP